MDCIIIIQNRQNHIRSALIQGLLEFTVIIRVNKVQRPSGLLGNAAEQVPGHTLHLSLSIIVLDRAKPVMDQYLKYRMFLYVFPLLAVEKQLAAGPGKILIIQIHLKGGIILTGIRDCTVQFIDNLGIPLSGGKIKGNGREFGNRAESLGQG